MLGLARVVAGLRADCTYPGDAGAVLRKRARPPCPVSDPSVVDAVWIPQVAARGWSIITRDRRIRERPAELAAVEEHAAKMFTLTSKEPLAVWDQLQLLMRQWDSIERLSTDPGPFIYALGRSGLAKVL